MIRSALIVSIAVSIAASDPEDSHLKSFRELANRLLKSNHAGSTTAFVEYAPTSQVDGCAGPRRNAVRHKISRNGDIESWDYRSPRESGDPVGYYRGRINDAQWRGLLETFAAMRWTENPSGVSGGPPPPPPPGPTESISILTLSDGSTKATYSKAGPAPDLIDNAFHQPGILSRAAIDTVWQLSLIKPKAEVRKDSLFFSAEWKWRGDMSAEVLFSQTAGGEFCGNARFKWFVDTSEFSVDWHEATASPKNANAERWQLNASNSAKLRISFPYDGPKGKVKAKRVGMLDGIGVRLLPSNSRDTLSVTLFTDRIEF